MIPSPRHVADTFTALALPRERVAGDDHALINAQISIAQIPAPTGDEGRRAEWIKQRFTALGLTDVRADDAGNIIGRRPGTLRIAPVVICAHLDTVFPPETNLTVRREGARLVGPGITDNGRGLAVMLALAEVIDGRSVELLRPVDFVATTGEEGAGDLRGVKHFFGQASRKVAAMIALDGAGDHRIIHQALGSRRYRVTIHGPGGHSWAAFGAPNAVHAAAGATSRLAAIHLPARPRTTLSVGRIGGGISVNSIPDHAWLEIDVRSTAVVEIDRMEREVHAAISAAIREENSRRDIGTCPLTFDIVRIGDRPSGETPADHPLVASAVAATKLVMRDPELAVASTDANVPIGLGIPAIAIGGGGRGGDAHATTEWFENTEGALGVARALTIVACAAQLAAD